ncbi:MAG TPA: high-potential iron-sulfur protein [Oleiagrimonas sp.]|nr:high-potential iron-sulfur protein [Oleiagrimonas sp.]
MSHDEKGNGANIESRRRFLKMAAGTAAVAAVAGTGAFARLAHAGGLPPLSESDPMAKALDYTEDASSTKNPKHKKGDDCANCTFYQGKSGAARGPCQLFPGKSVNAKGWCVSHNRKAT